MASPTTQIAHVTRKEMNKMITITIIICITVILIVAIICYKEYKISNGSNLSRIETELRQMRSEIEINDRILGKLADSILYISKERQNKVKTCDSFQCEMNFKNNSNG